jgi:DNA repair ATPase RecN
MNPNDTAAAGIHTLQASITKLNDLKQQPGADIPGINAQIRALTAKVTGIRTLALQQDLDDAPNQSAITTLTDAAKSLTAAAGEIKNVATALNDAVQVVNAASSLIKALAPFIL